MANIVNLRYKGLLLGVILVMTIIIIAIFVIDMRKEGYASKREKVEKIHSWFKSAKNPTYKDYQREVPDSDIVDYTAAKKLYKTSGFTVDRLESQIV